MALRSHITIIETHDDKTTAELKALVSAALIAEAEKPEFAGALNVKQVAVITVQSPMAEEGES